MKLVTVSLAILLSAGALCAGGPVVYVDAVHGDDVAGTGALAAPYQTISKALSAVGAAADATVQIAPGNYNVAHGETFPLVMASGMTLQGAGYGLTWISGDGQGTLVSMGRHGLVSDVTVRRGDIGVFSKAPAFAQDFRYLRRCVLSDNVVGTTCQDDLHSDSGFALVSCSVVNNTVGIRHKSTDNDFQSITMLLYGTTVTNNGVAIQFDGFGETYLGAFDSIVRDNADDSLATWAGFGIYPGITGNDLGDPAFVGVGGNVDVNPGLTALISSDVHLTATSLLRDTPAPAPIWPPTAQYVAGSQWIWEPTYEEIGDLEGDPRNVGGAVDPGCDEYASPSVYALGLPKLGAMLTLVGQGEPAETLFLGASAAVYGAPLAGWLWLQPPIAVLPALATGPEGVGSLSAPLPSAPSLAGVDLYAQAIRVVVASGAIEGSLPDRLTLLP